MNYIQDNSDPTYKYLIIYKLMPNIFLKFIKSLHNRIVLNNNYLFLLSQREIIKTSVFLNTLYYLKVNNFTIDNTYGNFSICITGPPRIGKTQLAKIVALHLNAQLICLDDFKGYFSNIDIEYREFAKFEMISFLCYFIGRVVIEGDELITNEHKILRKNYEKYEILKSLISDITSKITPHLFTVGSSECSYKKKADDMYLWGKNNYCWFTSNSTKSQVMNYARLIVQISRELKIISKKYNLQYIELGSGQFEYAADKILHKVNQSHISSASTHSMSS